MIERQKMNGNEEEFALKSINNASKRGKEEEGRERERGSEIEKGHWIEGEGREPREGMGVGRKERERELKEQERKESKIE